MTRLDLSGPAVADVGVVSQAFVAPVPPPSPIQIRGSTEALQA